jgi:hypothetical protein
LAPLLEGTREAFRVLDAGQDILMRAKITADSGFHSKAVIAAVEAIGADAYVADRDFRKREPAFADAARHKERRKKQRALKRRRERETRSESEGLFTAKDFQYDEVDATCMCPAGHKLYRSGQDMLRSGYRAAHFKARITACRGCHLRSKCLRHPERTPQRTLLIIKHRKGPAPKRRKQPSPTDRMRFKFDTPQGSALYAKRIGTVEPVFGNLQNKGMGRFTLRGRSKVNAQWLLFALVHNIEKIAGARWLG